MRIRCRSRGKRAVLGRSGVAGEGGELVDAARYAGQVRVQGRVVGDVALPAIGRTAPCLLFSRRLVGDVGRARRTAWLLVGVGGGLALASGGGHVYRAEGSERAEMALDVGPTTLAVDSARVSRRRCH